VTFSRVWRATFVAVATSVLIALAPVQALAQEVDPPVAPGEFVESWALSPAGDQAGEPSSRATLSYTVAPGGTIDDAVTLWNYSAVPIRFRLLATDAFNNKSGAFSLLRSDESPEDLGAWISVGTSAVRVPARTSVTIPITLRVPPDALPGDHAAAILAASETVGVDDRGNRIDLDRRTGPRVYLRVSGPVNPELVIEDMSSKYHGAFNPFDGGLDVTYTVRNPGNVRLGAKQTLVVKDVFGRTVETRKLDDLEELLPGNIVTFTEHMTGVPATFRVSATVQLEPFTPRGVTDEPPSELSATTHAWAIPWTLLLLLALAYVLWRLSRRWRDRRSTPPSSPSAPERIPEPVR